MTYNDKTKAYSLKYAKERLKRVPLDLPLEEYKTLQEAAQSAGESVNGFIKAAIRERIQRLE